MMDDIQHLAGQVSAVPSQDGIVRSYKPVRYDMAGLTSPFIRRFRPCTGKFSGLLTMW